MTTKRTTKPRAKPQATATEERGFTPSGASRPTWASVFLDAPTRSGVCLNDATALTLSTVFRAARVLSESVGTMPLKLYRSSEQGRDEARNHPLWTILHDEPNSEQSTVDFLTLMMWWAVLQGNAYAEIVRTGSGEVTELLPINPTRVKVDRVNGALVYLVEGVERPFPANDILHVKGPSPDGSQGYKLVQLAKESLSFSLALDQFGSYFFANSCKIGGTLKYPGQLSPIGKKNLEDSFANEYAGLRSVGKIPVLEEGTEFTPYTVSNEAGQYNETKNAEVYSVCRWFGVDPIFLYEYGRATWANAEAQTRNFLQFSLNPWLRKIECELSRKVILPSERQTIYAEFVRESIIQMDAKTQADIWKVGVEGGWYEPNEIRKWLNLPPRPEPKQEPAPAPDLQNPTQQEPNGNTVDNQQG